MRYSEYSCYDCGTEFDEHDHATLVMGGFIEMSEATGHLFRGTGGGREEEDPAVLCDDCASDRGILSVVKDDQTENQE